MTRLSCSSAQETLKERDAQAVKTVWIENFRRSTLAEPPRSKCRPARVCRDACVVMILTGNIA